MYTISRTILWCWCLIIRRGLLLALVGIALLPVLSPSLIAAGPPADPLVEFAAPASPKAALVARAGATAASPAAAPNPAPPAILNAATNSELESVDTDDPDNDFSLLALDPVLRPTLSGPTRSDSGSPLRTWMPVPPIPPPRLAAP